MSKISYSRHRFPSAVIHRSVWLYFRFPLSFRDVEEMLAERGIEVSYETIRRWILKFGPAIAANIRSRRARPSGTWHLDEVFVRIAGKRTYLWRAVDDEGEVLEVLAQSRRNKRAALKLMRKLLKKQGYIPDEIVTDKLGSYSAALRELGLEHLHVTGGRLKNRAEVSHQPARRRERRMGRFKSPGSMQCFLSVHDAIYNHFNLQRHLISRPNLRQIRSKSFAEWHQIVSA
ncbi:IS6 family transposase [Pseudohalocynthiibacter aestuariivivens]|uniref:IS6 family transposase n=1 Tax=Pseudohalocynthiibacter aestuariivivens TaxID=1591409 RepID=A0ABV5JBQ6_9RHOB|nr:IS6 family transposase [Pseudohalocynthiibacter aestuariivivens]MBS9718835.1 IS6 family transposase [Pseudohalocynthiibacter aestuariivivens]